MRKRYGQVKYTVRQRTIKEKLIQMGIDCTDELIEKIDLYRGDFGNITARILDYVLNNTDGINLIAPEKAKEYVLKNLQLSSYREVFINKFLGGIDPAVEPVIGENSQSIRKKIHNIIGNISLGETFKRYIGKFMPKPKEIQIDVEIQPYEGIQTQREILESDLNTCIGQADKYLSGTGLKVERDIIKDELEKGQDLENGEKIVIRFLNEGKKLCTVEDFSEFDAYIKTHTSESRIASYLSLAGFASKEEYEQKKRDMENQEQNQEDEQTKDLLQQIKNALDDIGLVALNEEIIKKLIENKEIVIPETLTDKSEIRKLIIEGIFKYMQNNKGNVLIKDFKKFDECLEEFKKNNIQIDVEQILRDDDKRLLEWYKTPGMTFPKYEKGIEAVKKFRETHKENKSSFATIGSYYDLIEGRALGATDDTEIETKIEELTVFTVKHVEQILSVSREFEEIDKEKKALRNELDVLEAQIAARTEELKKEGKDIAKDKELNDKKRRANLIKAILGGDKQKVEQEITKLEEFIKANEGDNSKKSLLEALKQKLERLQKDLLIAELQSLDNEMKEKRKRIFNIKVLIEKYRDSDNENDKKQILTLERTLKDLEKELAGLEKRYVEKDIYTRLTSDYRSRRVVEAILEMYKYKKKLYEGKKDNGEINEQECLELIAGIKKEISEALLRVMVFDNPDLIELDQEITKRVRDELMELTPNDIITVVVSSEIDRILEAEKAPDTQIQNQAQSQTAKDTRKLEPLEEFMEVVSQRRITTERNKNVMQKAYGNGEKENVQIANIQASKAQLLTHILAKVSDEKFVKMIERTEEGKAFLGYLQRTKNLSPRERMLAAEKYVSSLVEKYNKLQEEISKLVTAKRIGVENESELNQQIETQLREFNQLIGSRDDNGDENRTLESTWIMWYDTLPKELKATELPDFTEKERRGLFGRSGKKETTPKERD